MFPQAPGLVGTLDAWQEYQWDFPEPYSELDNTTYWGGTDPTDLDSDDDTMPDGFEAWWGHDPMGDDADGNTIRGYVDLLDNGAWEFVEVKSGTLESVKNGFSNGGRDLEQFREYKRLHNAYKPRIFVSKEVKKAIDEGALDSKHPLSQIIRDYGKQVIEEGPSQAELDGRINSFFSHLPERIGVLE
jgi:hypothetical protein